jgi:iron complex transport system substrate-binding protein
MKRAIASACLGLALAGCAKKPDAKPATASRVVSLSPSTTEAMFAIGAGSQLVGRSRYCDHPPEVKKLPQVGGYVDPSFEAILGLRPDLVTGARGPIGTALTDRLDARGVATYFPPTESFESIGTMMLGLGDRTGHAAESKAAVATMQARVKAVEAAVAGARKSVLLVFGVAPLVVAGPQSFADEMIRRAGGRNVVEAGGGYPTMDVERVIALDPDVVINAIMSEENAKERITAGAPGWGHVRAVKENHVVAITDEAVLRPGPRVGDGLALLARAIHPERTIP